MRPLRRLAVLAVTALLAVPAVAPAAQTVAPPGNAGVDEYLETVPGATGSGPSHGSSGKDGDVPAKVRAGLDRLGADGRAALAAADSGAPRSSAPAKQAPAPLVATPAPTSASPASGIAHAIGGSSDGGMGVLLPILLAASAAGLIALGLQRRRAA